MAFLTGRVLTWLIVGGAGLTIVATLWLSGLSKGKAIVDRMWRTAVVERVEAVRSKNFQLNRETLGTDSDRLAQEAEINERWGSYPKASPPKLVGKGELFEDGVK